MCDEKTAIRVLLRFFWKKGYSAKLATEQICEVEGENIVNRKTASNWFKRFNGGDTSLEEKPRCGRPSVVNENDLRDELTKHPNSSTRELSRHLALRKIP